MKRETLPLERCKLTPEMTWGLDVRVRYSFRQAREILTPWERHCITIVIYAGQGGAVAAMAMILIDLFQNMSPAAIPKGSFQLAILAAWLLLGFFTLRLRSFPRLAAKTPVPGLQELTSTMEKDKPVTVVIPAFREPLEVLARSLYSALLQNYPRKNLVLLVDNPPDQTADEAAIIQRLSNELTELDSFVDGAEKKGRVADAIAAYIRMERYLERLADSLTQMADKNNQKRIFQFLEDARLHFVQIRSAIGSLKEQTEGQPQEVTRALEPLRRISRTRISFFNRKAWTNLSHARTKADNLNVFLNLFGKPVREVGVDGGRRLVVDGLRGAVLFPRTEYICFLDADTNVAPDYLLNLVAVMERPENKKAAMAQTMCQYEYDAGNQIAINSAVEFDLASLAIRGFAADELALWVGTNGLARFDLLEKVSIEDGDRRKYIHDRTVTEDAETSVALWKAGYEILTYPEVMGWSLGPADIGSLISQRERWNIGVPIHVVKTLSGQARKKARRAMVFTCPADIAFIYLSSILAVGAVQDMPILANMPGLAGLVVLGYFLHKLGYGYTRLFHFFGHQALTVPAYLMGIVKTLLQIMTGRKSDYARTSRLTGETLVPAIYRLVYALMALNLVWGLMGRTGTDGVQQILQGLNLGSFLYLAHADSQGKNIFLAPFKRALNFLSGRSVSTGEPFIPKS